MIHVLWLSSRTPGRTQKVEPPNSMIRTQEEDPKGFEEVIRTRRALLEAARAARFGDLAAQRYPLVSFYKLDFLLKLAMNKWGMVWYSMEV